MHRLIRIAVIVTTSITAFDATAAELDNHAVASAFSYGIATETGVNVQGELELIPALELTLIRRASLTASARMRLDTYDELVPGEPTYDNYSPASRPITLGDAGSLEIRDFYFEIGSDNGLTRIGKQQIAWGRLDGIKVLDLVNPQDFREFIMEDFGNSRIGLWSAYFDYSFGQWRAELALIPDGTGHAIPESGAWFELTAPRFRFGAAPDQATPPTVTARPGSSLSDSAVGLRISRQYGSLEFSLVAYSGRDPEPLGRAVLLNGDPVVERFYERRDALGLSFDLGLGSGVLRAEYAYQPKRIFNSRLGDQLATIALDQHRAAIGFDIDGPFGVFINAQYLVDTVADPSPGLVRPASDRIATLYLRRTFAYDALAVEARWYHSFTDEDRLASISVEYELSDSTSFKLAAQHFDGVPEGLFGQFTNRDRITLSLSHVF